MLSVYESFHQAVKYGWQRNHTLQDLTGLEIKISMKSSKIENGVETSFQQPNSGLQKTGINIHGYYLPLLRMTALNMHSGLMTSATTLGVLQNCIKCLILSGLEQDLIS